MNSSAITLLILLLGVAQQMSAPSAAGPASLPHLSAEGSAQVSLAYYLAAHELAVQQVKAPSLASSSLTSDTLDRKQRSSRRVPSSSGAETSTGTQPGPSSAIGVVEVPPLPPSNTIRQTETPVQEPFPGAVPARYYPGTQPFRSIYAASQTYRRTGFARVVPLDDGTEVYPYGKKIPVVKVPILHFTTLELAPNEYATNRSVGDQERWSIETGTKGEKGNFTQLVYVKPRACGPLRTNLTIATNQGRTYELTLRALPCDPNGTPRLEGWTRKISWYYPDGTVPDQTEMQHAMAPPPVAQGSPSQAPMGYPSPQYQQASQPQFSPSPLPSPLPSPFAAPPSQAPPSPETSGRIASPTPRSTADVDVRNANTSNYKIRVDRRFPCEPEFVSDDGERMTIRLGDGPSCAVTFPFYRINSDRTLELVNYQVFNGNTYVVQGVFEKSALLFRDANGREHRATFINTTFQDERRARRGRR